MRFAFWQDRWFLADSVASGGDDRVVLWRPYDPDLVALGFRSHSLSGRAVPMTESGDCAMYSRSIALAPDLKLWRYAAAGPLIHLVPTRWALDSHTDRVVCTVDDNWMTEELCELRREGKRLRAERGQRCGAASEAERALGRAYSQRLEEAWSFLQGSGWEIVPRESAEKIYSLSELRMMDDEDAARLRGIV
jgi:hypothetical protein